MNPAQEDAPQEESRSYWQGQLAVVENVLNSIYEYEAKFEDMKRAIEESAWATDSVWLEQERKRFKDHVSEVQLRKVGAQMYYEIIEEQLESGNLN